MGSERLSVKLTELIMEEKNLKPEEINKEQLQEETKSEATADQTAVVEEKPEKSNDIPEEKTKSEETNPEEEVSNQDEELTPEEEEEEEEIAEDHYDDFTREQLVEELENLVTTEDINSVKRKVGMVKMAYLRLSKAESIEEETSESETAEEAPAEDTDAKPETAQETEVTVEVQENTTGEEPGETEKEDEQKPRDPLASRYRAAFKIYRKKKEEYQIALEAQKVKNLEAKNEILEQLKNVISSDEPLKKSYDEFKALQEKWREIGMVPKTEVNNLWQSYHFLVEKFFDNVKINNELRDLDLKKNLEKKVQLCESAEELLLETSIIKSFKQLQELHQEWKDTGPVPSDQTDELWTRFKNITEKINARRRDHYTRIREEQENNYNAKLALCEQVEEVVKGDIKSIKEWNTKTDSVNELLKIWKTIGPAPKATNDEIWARFKGNLNAFFERKKEFFNKLKDQQINNYNLKLDLCNQAESIKDSEDWKETTRALIDLQKKWKTIGPVPKKYSDKVWKRFRAACDEFFNRKEEFFGHIHEHEAENLEKKRSLIERVKNQEFGTKKSENLAILKEFQREWMSIGHVPIKEKDAVQKEFRSIVDEKLEQLKINEMEISTMNFKNRIENMKDGNDANRAMYRERTQLINKISKLNDDINLWENNIGFLAESKNANLLKREFDKKIQRAKQDVALLNAKLKILNEQF
ncbi:MAG: DUF349 domain-containing protein [Marinilabiliales bacterium]|nr:MAG: DUF349 domain-containing protein [Marinilabiliales bacterium]